MAKLYFRYSVMDSGKTTSLMQTAFNYEERGMRVVVLKPATDTKSGNAIQSRLGIRKEVDALIGAEDNIDTLLAPYTDARCILVDEAQFLTPQQVDQLFWYATQKDIPVIAYGLRTDFLTKGFPGATRLLELAHDLQELKTVCRCGRKAVLNGRKLSGKFVFEGNQVAIDGQQNVEYESLCASCYGKFKAASV